MNGFVLSVLVLVIPGCSQGLSLDKTGTSGVQFGSVGSKTLEKQEPAGAGSFQAEREGLSYQGPIVRVVRLSRCKNCLVF